MFRGLLQKRFNSWICRQKYWWYSRIIRIIDNSRSVWRQSATHYINKVILCPRIDNVDQNHEEVLKSLDGEVKTYISVDSIKLQRW